MPISAVCFIFLVVALRRQIEPCYAGRVDSFFQADIMGHLVSNGLLQSPQVLHATLTARSATGLAMYDPPLSKSVTPTAAFIYYRKPEEWGEIIYLWVRLDCLFLNG